LSVRTHKCSCGFVANRDHNAALNILALGLKSLDARFFKIGSSHN
jgi:putative transposase